MKQLLAILFCVALCSCHVVRKQTDTEHSTVDSSANKTSVQTAVKKKEAGESKSNQSTVNTTTKDTYKKTTVNVKEYFGDEFGFGEGEDTAKINPISGVHVSDGATISPANKTPGNPEKNLKFRETTTIVEEGVKNAFQNAVSQNSQTAKINESDSLRREDGEQTNSISNNDKKHSFKITLSIVPWWIWLLVLIGVGWWIYQKVKP